ncbi:Signal transduction histidine kinase [Pricia antarctica]|uniref:histidine kinase n=1 Tax=Pricia antarctica TaxID=641691 RepID=A0A1G7FAC3_9FLAO|nr:hybrid sensor histidine kinase/response regulator transcription factor [Pricia antarctica]SDE72816.1 Signal transduction histidine kinase [Pricia antarctica]
MHTKCRRLIGLFFFFLLAILAHGQEEKLDYAQHLTISEGLAHNGITSILEDSRGYMWIGTYDGLNRYDGYDLKTFKNKVDNIVLVNNRVRAIKEDIKGNIWIGTDSGISLYHYTSENFNTIYSNLLAKKGVKGPIIRDITIDDTGFVLCATEKEGILVFNKDYTLRGQFLPPEDFIDGPIEFFSPVTLDGDHYVYATSKGLIGFSPESGQFQKILPSEIDFSRSITKITDNTLLVTLSSGIALISFKKEGKQYTYDLLRINILNTYNFNSATFDETGHLWLGTLNEGAIRIDTIQSLASGSLGNFLIFKSSTGLLRVSAFMSTKNNGFWLSTFDKGLYRFAQTGNPFKSVHGEIEFNFGVSNGHLRQLAKLDKNRFYLTTNRGGLALFNTISGNFDPLAFTLNESYLSRVSAIYVDSKKNTWFKITGVGYFKLDAGELVPKRIDTSSLPGFDATEPYKITEDKKGNIWLGCRNGGYRITLNPFGKVLHIEALNDHSLFRNAKLSLVRYVYADPLFDYIWLGTAEDGLFRLAVKDNRPMAAIQIDQYRNDGSNRALPNNFVSNIVRSSRGELWIGTEGAGICKVMKSDGKPEFLSFSEKQGLSNNVVKSILIDHEQNLWVTTNIGLNKFNTKEQKFRRFSKEDGLPFEDFWYGASLLDNGYFVVTGLEGFCYFKPGNIPDKEQLPNLQFGDLKIFNKTIRPMDTLAGRVILPKRLSNTDTLNLKYNENVFSVELHALHYAAPENHFIKYKLLPIDTNWIEAPSDQRILNYNGLQPGKYKLEVAASNSIGEWTEPKILNISIAPPFWKTPLAYLLYALLALLILGIVLYYILKIQSLRHNVEIEQLEKNKEKEVNAAKLRFLANISHELKTPLNLITSPVRILSERYKGNADVKEKLNIIQRQSRKITHLVDQVHDFERAEANLIEMNYTRFYFDVFLEDLLIDFRFLATNNNRQLEVIGKHSNIVVSADRDKLEKVFNNLLSNAFKYSSDNANITIEYESNDKDLIVSVKNTGKGIDAEDLPHIFERFYQSHNKNNIHSTGSGIGLAFSKRLIEMHYGYIEAESKLEKGTTIHVRLPIVKKESALDQERREQTILLAEKEFSIQSQLDLKVDTAQIKASGNYTENLIFYVEDNADMRHYVSQFLSKFYKVKTFNDGQECLSAMEDEWPDLIVSDIQMPKLNGLELCKQIKSDMATSHIPIILLTALTDIDDHIRGIRDGADAYIKKPFDVRQLIAQSEGLLENKTRLRERFEVGIPLTHDNDINNRNDNAFLEKLYNLMAENLDNQDLEIDQFARKLYLNRTHFYQKVKALTNHTPFELLKMYRLKKAAELLTQKQELSVNEVSIMIGFKSRTHFSKLFKNKYKVSPGKYSQAKKM